MFNRELAFSICDERTRATGRLTKVLPAARLSSCQPASLSPPSPSSILPPPPPSQGPGPKTTIGCCMHVDAHNPRHGQHEDGLRPAVHEEHGRRVKALRDGAATAWHAVHLAGRSSNHPCGTRRLFPACWPESPRPCVPTQVYPQLLQAFVLLNPPGWVRGLLVGYKPDRGHSPWGGGGGAFSPPPGHRGASNGNDPSGPWFMTAASD